MEERVAQLTAKIEADSSIVEKLFALEDSNEVQAFLKAEGIDFSLDEIEEIKGGFAKLAAKGDGELSDADLEDVAGGFVITAAGVTAAAALIGAIGAALPGIIGGIGSIIRRRW